MVRVRYLPTVLENNYNWHFIECSTGRYLLYIHTVPETNILALALQLPNLYPHLPTGTYEYLQNYVVYRQVGTDLQYLPIRQNTCTVQYPINWYLSYVDQQGLPNNVLNMYLALILDTDPDPQRRIWIYGSRSVYILGSDFFFI